MGTRLESRPYAGMAKPGERLTVHEWLDLDEDEPGEWVDGRYFKAVGRTEGQVGEIPNCPGLEVDLDALWARLQRLRSSE